MSMTNDLDVKDLRSLFSSQLANRLVGDSFPVISVTFTLISWKLEVHNCSLVSV